MRVIGVQEIVASNDHLVLLSKATTNEDKIEHPETKPKWTLYNLALPAPLALYNSIIELADLSRAVNPHGYLELISEAHIVLRTSCHHLGMCPTFRQGIFFFFFAPLKF